VRTGQHEEGHRAEETRAAAPERARPEASRGSDRLLAGILLGVLTFWMFAQTTLNIAPAMGRELGLDSSTMNIAVAITALFSGIFIVVLGGLADRFGRVSIMKVGLYLSIGGSLLVGLAPAGRLAAPVLLAGRALQGLSGACIMPASLALVKAYWDGAARQRAISLWSIGSWGGSGVSALFGGLVAQNLGWRYIFFASVAVAFAGLLLTRGTPESKAESTKAYRFDLAGVTAFMIAMLALQVVVTQGNRLGWGSPAVIVLGAVAVIVGALFFRFEARAPAPFIDFRLFRNATYAGATISNFLLNGVAGTQIVTLQLVQLGGDVSAQQAGLLTLGYAITIVAFIRVGEKLLQRFGARKPMIWGCLVTALSILLFSATNVMLATYKVVAVVGYALFGLGLALYATPSTDAALSGLPESQVGAGSGIYKMASSLGAAFGVAMSAAIFTALRSGADSARWLEGVITFQGRQSNLAIREAAIVALMVNVGMVAAAILSIALTIPGQGRRAAAARESGA
jgi:DHA2 family multidrug resistance protein-like MFS transporter